MKRIVDVLALVAALVAVVVVTGCSASDASEAPEAASASASSAVAVEVDPALLVTEGVLTVGVDYAYMPYSGRIGDELMGIDVDLSALVAEDLGLKVAYVDVAPGDGAAAVQDGRVDVMMSTVLGKVAPSVVALAGAYASEAPAIFALVPEGSTPPSLDLSTARIGAQSGSLASWELKRSWGATEVSEYETLVGAFDALVAGEVDAVAGDAMVASHLRSLYPDVRFVAQLTPADVIGIGASPEKPQLVSAVQSIVDAAVADGRMGLILARWVGEMPALTVQSEGTVFPSTTP